MTIVRKDILNGFIIDNQTDVVSHPYCSVFHIKELSSYTKKSLGKTQVVNVYDNKIGNGQVMKDYKPTIQHIIQDIP